MSVLTEKPYKLVWRNGVTEMVMAVSESNAISIAGRGRKPICINEVSTVDVCADLTKEIARLRYEIALLAIKRQQITDNALQLVEEDGK